jgi:hypothetical protein
LRIEELITESEMAIEWYREEFKPALYLSIRAIN